MGNMPELRYCHSDCQCYICSDNTINKHHCHIYMCGPFVLQHYKILHVCIHTKSLWHVIVLLCVCHVCAHVPVLFNLKSG